jgi:cellulose biosynthesis protein BcsQ
VNIEYSDLNTAQFIGTIECSDLNPAKMRGFITAHQLHPAHYETVIPRNVRLAEAPSYGLPGVVFDPAAKGSQAFLAFAREMVKRGLSE